MKSPGLLSALALFVVTIVSAVYITFGVLGANPFADTNKLTMTIPSRSQLQVGSPVNLYGIKIGSVKTVERSGTDAKLTLAVETKYDIPANSEVRIEQLSAVGEPYINFVPASLRAPYLPNNATIAAERVSTPPETVDVFKRISSLTNAIESNDVTGLLESLRAATSATPEALNRVLQAGNLFEQVIASRMPQIRSMLEATQRYQSNIGWLPAAIGSSASAFTDVLGEARTYLDAIDGVVRDAGTPGINRDVITPFVQKIGPDATRLLVSLGPIAGPLIPVIQEATQQTPQIDMATLLSSAAHSFDSNGNLRIRLVPTR